MPVDPNRVREIFLAALERSAADRPDFLADACQGDAELRAEVDRLLVANADPDSILEPVSLAPGESTAAFDPAGRNPTETAIAGQRPDMGTETAVGGGDREATKTATLGAPRPGMGRVQSDKAIGTIIAGRYTLVEVIGQGGMGSVYRANQSQPVKRQVALKLIKTGMDSRDVLARFDAERQALALMDHPNIARIYDGGVTDAGQPFFVMELVDGLPLTEYCDQKRLPVKDRLELFVSVCQAVQHAHQKGIIHRDLKPSNVLVTEVDGRATPKVIDFGVAKATEQKLTDMSFADTGAIVGTPTYMSPEQADPNSMDIDTRTDVYALGVMLYELLTGSPPIDAKQFQRGAILEMLRMVREVDPPRPSTKLSTAEGLPNIAANRSIEPARLGKLLRGELDWVVMKALEKDRNRRYDTANGLARDLQRYLADEVVEARPPSAAYRLRKFVRRHQGQVLAASLVLLALLGGVVGTTWGLIRAERANDDLVKKNAELDAERDRARDAAARAATVNDFLLKDLLGQADPTINPVGKDITIRELLDRAADRVGRNPELTRQPEVELAIRDVLGTTYLRLGLFAQAEDQIQRALATAERIRGDHHEDVFALSDTLGVILRQLSRLADAEKLLARAYRGRLSLHGPLDERTLTSRNNLAIVLMDQGEIDRAEEIYRDNVRVLTEQKGADDPQTLYAVTNLAWVLETRNTRSSLEESEALLRERMDDVCRVWDEDSPRSWHVLNQFGNLLRKQGKLDEAERYLRLAVEGRARVLGESSEGTATSLNTLGLVLLKSPEKYAEAEECFRRAIGASKPVAGREPLSLLSRRHNLGLACWKQGKLKEAEEQIRHSLNGSQAILGESHPTVLQIRMNLGMVLDEAGSYGPAEEEFRNVLAHRSKAAPTWERHSTEVYLGGTLLRQHRANEAEPYLLAGYRGLLELATTIPAGSTSRLSKALDLLIELYTALGKPDEAEKWRKKREAIGAGSSPSSM